MPTPVGPAPRDPNDPDFWDWSAPEDDERPMGRRHPLVAIVALVLIASLLLLVLLSVL